MSTVEEGQSVESGSAPKTQYYRRVIAPPIMTEPEENHSTDSFEEEVNTSSAQLSIVEDVAPIPLSRNELLLAKKAEYYIQRNFHKETGLWNSVQGYNHTTMWDVASGIAATLALEALGMKETEQVRYELEKTLSTLSDFPLYKDTLPNREYSTKTGLPSGRLSDTESNGNGWSALDIGRLLIWLKVLEQQHPELSPSVEKVVTHWDLSKAVHNGTLFGTKLHQKREYYRQEGRNGYLQYAAEGFKMYGYDLPFPDLDGYLKTIEIQGINIQIDSRNVPFLTSDPYVLASIEYQRDPSWSQLVPFYELHKNKWKETGVISAYAEDAMNKNPWFAYNNIYYYGKSWTSVSPSGKVIENPQVLSNKVGFGFSVLFDDEFSDLLYQEVLDSSLKFRSVPAGKYTNGGINSSLNINTNSLILVALWYKSKGRNPILN
ncbi:DUF3131 domain-containing protein [Vibrio pelagius]|uniref:DUF3131 domain-containing protein n=1 Tax=Vibrio pelagius TaxID=28169 RepID=UPI0035500ACF